MEHALLKLRYDPQRDLAPVAALAKNDLLVVVHPSTRIRSLADLIAAAKARPGALTFASAGKASPSHLCAEMLKRQADIDMTHNPYSAQFQLHPRHRAGRERHQRELVVARRIARV